MKNEKNLEIEKKYLFSVEKAPFKLNVLEKHYIEQSYISTLPTIRVRKLDDKYILTIKTKNKQNKNISVDNELETYLSKEEYDSLLTKKIKNTRTISKFRYYYKLTNTLTLEIDEFLGDFKGLFVAEIEFSSIEEAENFQKPSWLGEDVTANSNFKNAVMAKTENVEIVLDEFKKYYSL